MEKHALARLLCDEEIRGTAEWNRFRTEILRCNRRLLSQNKLKVAAWPSHKTALIQAADCVAYVYARSIRGASLDERLRENLRALQSNADSIFIVTNRWEGET